MHLTLVSRQALSHSSETATSFSHTFITYSFLLLDYVVISLWLVLQVYPYDSVLCQSSHQDKEGVLIDNVQNKDKIILLYAIC